MNNRLTLSDELIAQYAENNVTDEERRLVLNYLTENPQELERVVALTSSLLVSSDSVDKVQLNPNQQSCFVDNEIVYSAAAFAPTIGVDYIASETLGIAKDRLSEIWDRLDKLSDELKIR